MKIKSLQDIHVQQVGIFCNDNADARLIVSVDANSFEGRKGRLTEIGSEAIVPYLNNLSEFSEKDRESMFRLYDSDTEYHGDDSWFELMEKHNGDLGRVNRSLCSGSYSDVNEIRRHYFGSNGAVLLQSWPDMVKNNGFGKTPEPRVNVYKNDYEFKKAQREFEDSELSYYNDNGSDLKHSDDSYEAVGFDPSHV